MSARGKRLKERPQKGRQFLAEHLRTVSAIANRAIAIANSKKASNTDLSKCLILLLVTQFKTKKRIISKFRAHLNEPVCAQMSVYSFLLFSLEQLNIPQNITYVCFYIFYKPQ